MNREEILSQCCTSECNWENIKACHKIEIYDMKLSEDDLKFLTTIRVHTLDLSCNNIGNNGWWRFPPWGPDDDF